MAKIKASKIANALKKAQRVGEVEEQFFLAGCSVVLRSLTNPEYVAAIAALEGMEDIDYAVAYRVEHLCRAFAEIDGESLRDVDFVEVDWENPKTQAVETKVLERHQFVKEYILASWSREAVDVAMRKFNDVVERAEKVASEGIKFETSDETSEEMYRRLLGEVKELEGTVPFELGAKIRDEYGYILKQEWAAADNLATLETPVEPPVVEPEPVREPAVVAQKTEAQPAPSAPSEPVTTSSILRRTVAPTPLPVGVPVMPPMGAPVVISPSALKKAAEIEALEGDLGVVTSAPSASNPATIENRPLVRDPVAAQRILDQPPTGGINPRFKAPPRI
jgi:hypothetical protein